MSEFRLGVVGDLHTHWDEVDVRLFDRSDYDLLYFTGDLGGGTPESTVRVARIIARLDKPALVMPGNNDTMDTAELAAELTHRAGLAALSRLQRGEGEQDTAARLCGYTSHHVQRADLDVTLIAARPHSMGGPELSFPDFMRDTYGVESLDASRERLIALVDASPSDRLVFLSHNGPVGLGGAHHDPWGADFKPEGGDWGDPDLADAIAHARQTGKRVLAVVAGHMHLRTKQGQARTWKVEEAGTVYVNAALVPRIFAGEEDMRRHHVSLAIRNDGVSVSEVVLGG